jgi:hypothetical protein
MNNFTEHNFATHTDNRIILSYIMTIQVISEMSGISTIPVSSAIIFTTNHFISLSLYGIAPAHQIPTYSISP